MGQRGIRTPLTVALDNADNTAILKALFDKSQVTENGCWVWPKLDRYGYGQVNYRKRSYGVHRIAMRAALGYDIGRIPVHHACAVNSCCNPDHLELVTQRENTAEMLERQYYVARIAELEEALRHIEPAHKLLQK